jgi:hypothetical protein
MMATPPTTLRCILIEQGDLDEADIRPVTVTFEMIVFKHPYLCEVVVAFKYAGICISYCLQH